jgi:outer membrane receptor protein involved in Fe transport
VLDSLARLRADSLRVESSRKRFIPSIGNLGQAIDTSSMFHSHEFIHSDVKYPGDLLSKLPGVFLRDLGQPGQPDQLNILGVDSRGISVQLDGRPLNDPVFGGYDLYDIPLEYVDEVEILQGSASLYGGANAPGGSINFVSHQYNNLHPLTKLRYFQGPDDYILSDGIFAQNITRALNAMFGFQRQVTDGRFTNSAYDSWNFRFRLRYNISEYLNVWGSEFYTKSTVGLNGGVDPTLSPSINDEVTAVVRDDKTYQIRSRHDLTAGIVGKFLADSASLSKLILYYSSLDREYTNGGGPGLPPVFSDFQGSSLWGMKFDQQIELAVAALDVGASLERRHVNHSHYLQERIENYAAANAKVSLHPVDWVQGSFSSRLERLRSDNSMSWGINVEANITPWLTLWGDNSTSFRYPTIQELYWTDTSLSRFGPLPKEKHSFLQLGLRLQAGPLTVSLAAFKRKVERAIVFVAVPEESPNSVAITSLPTEDYSGGSADMRLSIWRLELTGNASLTDSKEEGISWLIIPRFTSFGELSYRDTFAKGNLDLKTGIRLKSVSHHDGLQFVPQLLAFETQNVSAMPYFTTIDFYLVAKLGDAYLTLTWENPINVNAMMVPFYPLMSRNIKLGVNWTFTD